MKTVLFKSLLIGFLISSISYGAINSQESQLEMHHELRSMVNQIDNHIKSGNSLEQIGQSLKNFDRVFENSEALIKLSYDLLLQRQNEQEVVDALLKYIDQEVQKRNELQKNDSAKYLKWAVGGAIGVVLTYAIYKVVDAYLHRYDPVRHDPEPDNYAHYHQRIRGGFVPADFEEIVGRFGQELGNIDFNRMSPLELAMFRARCLRIYNSIQHIERGGRADHVLLDGGWRWCNGAIHQFSADPQRAREFLHGDRNNWLRLIGGGRE